MNPDYPYENKKENYNEFTIQTDKGYFLIKTDATKEHVLKIVLMMYAKEVESASKLVEILQLLNYNASIESVKIDYDLKL